MMASEAWSLGHVRRRIYAGRKTFEAERSASALKTRDIGTICMEYNFQSIAFYFDLLLAFRTSFGFLIDNHEQSSGMEFTKLISTEEVSRHSTPSDLWIVIEDAVWDVSSFAPDHPGGVACMTPMHAIFVRAKTANLPIACSDSEVRWSRRHESLSRIPQSSRSQGHTVVRLLQGQSRSGYYYARMEPGSCCPFE